MWLFDILWKFIAGLIGLIGLASLPEDIQTWWGFLSSIEPYIDTVIVKIGSVFLLGFLIADTSLKINTRYERWKGNRETQGEPTDDQTDTMPLWVPLHEAMTYVMENLGLNPTTETDRSYLFLQAGNELRQAGADGAVRFRGNQEMNRDMLGPPYKNIKTDIPQEYWERMEISFYCMDETAQEEPQTQPDMENLGDRTANSMSKYYHVIVNNSDMRLRWNKSAKK